MKRPRIALGAVAAVALLALPGLVGCWNGAFSRAYHSGGSGDQRFALVIEADRTDLAGTHFLVDGVTGDVWWLDAPDATSGSWIKLAEGPEDAKELEPAGDAQKRRDDDGD